MGEQVKNADAEPVEGKAAESAGLKEELEETFPASDTPASVMRDGMENDARKVSGTGKPIAPTVNGDQGEPSEQPS